MNTRCKFVGVLSLLYLLLTSGCGFQLRGAYNLPAEMQTTYIEMTQNNPSLLRALKRALKASDINVVKNKIDNIAVLTIIKETKSKRIESVDSEGRAREYTLTYAISFHVKSDGKQFEIESQEVRIDRDFQFDTEDVLGKSREESRLYEEMQQDSIRLILLRLQSKA